MKGKTVFLDKRKTKNGGRRASVLAISCRSGRRLRVSAAVPGTEDWLASTAG